MVIKGKIKENKMGLACSQIRLLTLTARKADCEYGISMNSMEKLALTREQSNLTSEYYSKLKASKITYFANGQYNKMNYGYLMGYGKNYTAITAGTAALKTDNSMILTDYRGAVVVNGGIAGILQEKYGINAQGRGGTFSQDDIPELISEIMNGTITADEIRTIQDGGKVERVCTATVYNTLSGNVTGTNNNYDYSEKTTELFQKIIDFYTPIFQACAANGWTTEYNKDMATNDDYISDALVTGTFCLAKVDGEGTYEPNTSLTYFMTAGLIQERTDSDAREEITAWYNAEKERISEKENFLDIEIRDLSTELEAINTEMESLKSLINDAIQTVFDWGSS